MPQLPSGLLYGVDVIPLVELFEAVDKRLRIDELVNIEEKVHLFEFIRVMYYRKCEHIESIEYAEGSDTPPENMESYDSGFNLYTIMDELKKWSQEDQESFAAFIDSRKFQDYLDDRFEDVNNVKKHILVDHSVPGWWWDEDIMPLQPGSEDEDNKGNWH